MLQFCKEFNARTSKVRTEVPLQVTILPYTDGSFKFYMRAPPCPWFIKRNARIPAGSPRAAKLQIGNIILKEVYHIAKAKCMDPPLIGVPLKGICRQVLSSARSLGVIVSERQLMDDYKYRNDTPVNTLWSMYADIRAQRKLAKKKK
eukprot:Platyproteum_vivax@DN5314_c0_g1_i2.p2